jgi:uncharacterized damage-inducible protein DinB
MTLPGKSIARNHMKRIVVFLLLSLSLTVHAEDKKPTTLRGVLLEQLRTTHNQKDWFVPVNIAVEGVTAEQATWTDGKGNHSIGQLTNHLLFWNSDQLARFKGETPPKFSGDNNETFNAFDSKKWAATIQQLDQVLTAWEKAVESADDAKLQQWASAIAHIGTHNAYHTGQIVYIRRQQGSWDPSKGVK